jgi:hypothetical protein
VILSRIIGNWSMTVLFEESEVSMGHGVATKKDSDDDFHSGPQAIPSTLQRLWGSRRVISRLISLNSGQNHLYLFVP